MSEGPLPASRFDAFATEWIASFNAHDLNRILGHYHADIELVSPLYLRFTGGLSDRVQGIDALEAYFHQALQRFPDLSFDLIEIADGARGPCLRYRSSLDGRIAMEAFELDEADKAVRVLCHYVGG